MMGTSEMKVCKKRTEGNESQREDIWGKGLRGSTLRPPRKKGLRTPRK